MQKRQYGASTARLLQVSDVNDGDYFQHIIIIRFKTQAPAREL